MTSTCETCLFWNGRADTVNKTVTLMSGKKDLRQITYSRECRRFPAPRPQVPYHDWCGEFKKK